MHPRSGSPRSGPEARAMQLDVLLKAFMDTSATQFASGRRATSDTGDSSSQGPGHAPLAMHVNNMSWEGIASLLPGVTAEQCRRRYLELQQFTPVPSIPKGRPGHAARNRDVDKAMRSQKIRLEDKSVTSLGGRAPAQTKASKEPGRARGEFLPPVCQSRSLVSRDLRTESSSANAANAPAGSVRDASRGSGTPAHGASVKRTSKAIGGSAPAPAGSHPDAAAAVDGLAKTEALGSKTGSGVWGRRHKQPPLSTGAITLSLPLDGEGPLVTVQVTDKPRGVEQNFKCPQGLLVKEMPFFASFFKEQELSAESSTSLYASAGLSTSSLASFGGIRARRQLSVAIKCDVDIFRDLWQFANRGRASSLDGNAIETPKLSIKHIFSVLLCAEYLLMPKLIDQCVLFIDDHLDEALATVPPARCFSEGTVRRLAELMPIEKLELLTDDATRLKSKIYMAKVRMMFEDPDGIHTALGSAGKLFRCQLCNRIMTVNMQFHLLCVASRAEVGRDGRVFYCHKRCPDWSPQVYLTDLRAKKCSWREKYWKLWGHLHVLRCGRCSMMFTASEYLGTCLRCPIGRFLSEPLSSSKPDGTEQGRSTSTLNQPSTPSASATCSHAPRFNALGRPEGCKAGQHRPKFCVGLATDARPASTQSTAPAPPDAAATTSAGDDDDDEEKALGSQSFAGLEQVDKTAGTNLFPNRSLVDLKAYAGQRPVPIVRSPAMENYSEIIGHLRRHSSIICAIPAAVPKWLDTGHLNEWYATRGESLAAASSQDSQGKVQGAGKDGKAAEVPSKPRGKHVIAKKKGSNPRKVARKEKTKLRARRKPCLSDEEEDVDSSSSSSSSTESSSQDETSSPAPEKKTVVMSQPHQTKLEMLASRERNTKHAQGYRWMTGFNSRQNQDSLRENDVVRMRSLGKQWAARRQGSERKQPAAAAAAAAAAARNAPGRLNLGIYGRLLAQAQAVTKQKQVQLQKERRRKKVQRVTTGDAGQSDVE